MKPTLFLPKGLPASGKSTWAKAKVKTTKNTYIVSRDSIREMMVSDYEDFPFGHSDIEKAVTAGVLELTAFLLSLEYSVILDETNLNKGRVNNFISELTKDLEILNVNSEFTIELIDFTDVPLQTCLKRDKKRGNKVGEKVIRGMHKKYLYNEPSNIRTKKETP